MKDIGGVSGFKRRGGWVDVVEHGERITQALHDLADDDNVGEAVGSDALDGFDEWRPKSHERLDDDVNERPPVLGERRRGQGRKAGKDPDDDLGPPARNSPTPTRTSTNPGTPSNPGARASTTSRARGGLGQPEGPARRRGQGVQERDDPDRALLLRQGNSSARTSSASTATTARSTSSRSTSTTTTSKNGVEPPCRLRDRRRPLARQHREGKSRPPRRPKGSKSRRRK